MFHCHLHHDGRHCFIWKCVISCCIYEYFNDYLFWPSFLSSENFVLTYWCQICIMPKSVLQVFFSSKLLATVLFSTRTPLKITLRSSSVQVFLVISLPTFISQVFVLFSSCHKNDQLLHLHKNDKTHFGEFFSCVLQLPHVVSTCRWHI